MKILKIEYIGGYRQVSKYLTLEHDANFAVIVDTLVNVYNMNLAKLAKINGHWAVKISNDFLSRQTGLGISIIKATVKKIEDKGLITAIKKGQGNTRHYVINIKNINSYIAALQPKFEQWFDKSLESSQKNKARSVEADSIKLKKSMLNFETTLADIASINGKPQDGLVENRPTQLVKIDQPNRRKPTVVHTSKETTKETTTETKNVVVEIFDQVDSKGRFIYVKEYNTTVYKNDYEEFINNYTEEQLEILIEEVKEKRNEDIQVDDIEEFDFNSTVSYKDEKTSLSNRYDENEIMIYIYDLILKAETAKKIKMKREYETTKQPACQDISNNNWKRLENAYNELPNIPNQGKFYTSTKDKNDFFNLSEYRQEWVIEQVVNMKNANTTTSRPSIYIEEAMQEKLKLYHNPDKGRVTIAI